MCVRIPGRVNYPARHVLILKTSLREINLPRARKAPPPLIVRGEGGLGACDRERHPLGMERNGAGAAGLATGSVPILILIAQRRAAPATYQLRERAIAGSDDARSATFEPIAKFSRLNLRRISLR